MQATQKISQAKAKLLLEYPYFGTLASKLELCVNDDIESFKSNGRVLEYREAYLQELTLREMEFVLANGAMHSVLAHEERKNNRSGWLWQMATDIAINDMLLQNGLSMPYGAQYRERFRGMYAEEIYAELKADILRDDEDLEYEADNADDVEQNQEQEEQKRDEELTQQLLAEEAISLLESQMKKGEIPESIERFFELEDFGRVDWRSELREALDPFFRDDYRVMPPSKKLLYDGIYLPSNTSQTFRLVIAVDSSASIDEELLNTFLSEVNFLMEQIQNYIIDIFVCDEQIHSHTTFQNGESLEVKIVGGGATDFRPVFDYIENNLDDVKLLLYFTDLDGIFPQESPPYSVKWITSQEEKKVPFGTMVLLD